MLPDALASVGPGAVSHLHHHGMGLLSAVIWDRA
jgi:hypothetical protein